MWDIVWVSPQGHRSVSVFRKSPFPSTDTAVSLLRAKTVQQRPLLLRNWGGFGIGLPDWGGGRTL